MSSDSSFKYGLIHNTHFVVRNITPDCKKTVFVFNAPINYLCTRNILALEGITEGDIRDSLLAGVLRRKLLNLDLEIVSSNIDLLQFSDKQRAFLQDHGLTEGVTIGYDELDGYVQSGLFGSGGTSLNYLWREKIPLIGMKDGINRTFYTSDKFINGSYFGNVFHLTVEHNGKELYENIDYSIAESSGPGTGYDTINIFSLTPNTHSLLFATYAIKN